MKPTTFILTVTGLKFTAVNAERKLNNNFSGRETIVSVIVYQNDLYNCQFLKVDSPGSIHEVKQ